MRILKLDNLATNTWSILDLKQEYPSRISFTKPRDLKVRGLWEGLPFFLDLGLKGEKVTIAFRARDDEIETLDSMFNERTEGLLYVHIYLEIPSPLEEWSGHYAFSKMSISKREPLIETIAGETYWWSPVEIELYRTRVQGTPPS